MMMLGTTAVALTCYSLLYASPVLGQIYYTITVAAIVFGIIAAIQLQRERRAFWLGFLIVAASYLGLAMVEKRESAARAVIQLISPGPGMQPTRAPDEAELITQHLLTICFDRYCLSQDPSYGRGRTDPYVRYSRVEQRLLGVRQRDPIYGAFMATGHSSIALLLGWLGGAVSRRMYLARSAESRTGT
jgi:hypothetical protein